ncbi:cytochrome b-c1 complex subunit 9 [Dichotomocladium elegans]|nr:cytochrome b-c1 complex subunit 9 [Dichotomocladium elegans]
MPAAGASSGITRTIYNTFFKRNSVFVTTIFAGALLFNVGFDKVTDKVWDDLNKGKQWKDIKHKYEDQ